MRYDTIAHVVFCTPELGAVGLTEAQALESHPDLDIYKADFRPMRATLSGSAERAIMKLVVDAGTQRVLGAHVLSHEAGEMVQLIAVAMTMGATKPDFDATVAVHPTAAEEFVTMGEPSARYRGGARL
jgi:glutathione reductase (NADPH)